MKEDNLLLKHIELIANCLSEGIIILDNRLNTLLINNTAIDILGITGKRKRGVHVKTMLNNKNSGLFEIINNSHNQNQGIKNMEFSFHRKRIDIRLNITIAFIKNNDLHERLTCIICNDISHLWKLHLKERELLNQLRENYIDHMENLRQIADSVAHEVRNPIVSIGGYTNLLLKKCANTGSNDADIKKYLNYIKEDAERLNRIVDQTEKYSDLKAVSFKRENITTLFSELFSYVRRLSKKHNIAIDLPPIKTDEYLIFIDRIKLRDAFEKLMKNAILLSSANTQVNIHLKFSQYKVEMAIDIATDKISMEEVHFIFTPFFSSPHQDLSFDLATAQRIIMVHGGIIKAELKDNQHLSFQLSLPKEKRVRRK